MNFKRRIFLINKPFQFRFAFYVCSWLFALSLSYLLIISVLFDYFFRYLALDPLGPTLASLEKTREDIFLLLVVMQLVLIGTTFLISIFMSHKIAGPLYKLKNYFRVVAQGDYTQKLFFRNRDHFQDLIEPYNLMMQSIQGVIEKKNDGIQSALASLERIALSSSPETQKDLESALAALKGAQQ